MTHQAVCAEYKEPPDVECLPPHPLARRVPATFPRRAIGLLALFTSLWCGAARADWNPHFEVLYRVNSPAGFGFPFPNYGVDLTVSGSGELHGFLMTLNCHCFGFAEAACDAQAYGLAANQTLPEVAKAWIEVRQRDAVNIASDFLHNRLAQPGAYAAYNFEVICEWLRDGRLVPILLYDDQNLTGHGVVAYAVTRSRSTGAYEIWYYDPNRPWGNGGDKCMYDADIVQVNGTSYRSFTGPRITLNRDRELVGISDGYTRFFAIQKYRPRLPANSDDWGPHSDTDEP